MSTARTTYTVVATSAGSGQSVTYTLEHTSARAAGIYVRAMHAHKIGVNRECVRVNVTEA